MVQTYLFYVVTIFFQLLTFAIFARVVLSWFRTSQDNYLVRLIFQITEPLLSRLRSLIPPIGGVLDISPIVAFFVIKLLNSLVLGLILKLSL